MPAEVSQTSSLSEIVDESWVEGFDFSREGPIWLPGGDVVIQQSWVFHEGENLTETSTGLLATNGGYSMTTRRSIWPRWFGGDMGGL